ncbi:PhzF family phenazine biosynthesis protein [Radicibacter daui]|uniref:PhzF family phenazine biosynthesis protein n=1 Tax=Radicibacter daui TaxID=3064829 RepID=UPI004046DE0A
MRMFQVDAFSDRPFTGNPAAVLIVKDWLPDETMLAIAGENNLAETAFARARAEGGWDLRWFAPAQEVDFCGHATLATAHVLLTEFAAAAPLSFHTRVGELRVSKAPKGYRLDLPCLPPEPLATLPDDISGIFPTSPVGIFRNFENIFAVLDGADRVRTFVPDLMSISRLGPVGLVVTGKEAPGLKADFVSRYFAPGAGIPEDPVTGSIHSTLVPYWAEQLGKNRMTAFQASSRGGWLECELAGDRVFLTGNAVTFMEARIFVPGYPAAG